VNNKYKMTDQGHGVVYFADGSAFLFDEIDLPLIQAHSWHKGKRGYPATHVRGKTVVLHRLLFPDAAGYEVDHINGDKMDNRRINLRLCTHQQNAFNQKRRCTNTSGYIGVSQVRDSSFYEAYIHHHGKKHHLGTFPDAPLAARTRDCVAKLLFGEYARLNYPRKRGRRHHGKKV